MSVTLLQDVFKFTDSEKMHIFCANAQEALLLGTVFQMRATASVVCRVMGSLQALDCPYRRSGPVVCQEPALFCIH